MPKTTRAAVAVPLLLLLFVACGADPASTEGADGGAPIDPNCGRLTTPCPPGGKCEGAPDCASSLCRDGTCREVAPPNGQKDADETDVDCGGTQAAACSDGKGCAVADDCTSAVCTGGVCQAPSPTDGVKNGDETGKDCGGAKAPKCPPGEGCASDADCNMVKCTDLKKCADPVHDDGIKNGDETGTDCGGPTAPKKCAPGDGCNADADCANVRCDTAAKKCKPPTKDDGLKNGTETDVDCGGAAPTNAPRCGVDKGCAAPSDCLSDGCAYDKKCALAPSCAPHFGGDTCGKGEVGEAGAAHESCCASLPLPNKTVRIDKYEITAGRMREFITRTGGNVRAWVDKNRAKTKQQIPDAMLPYLPEGDSAPTRTITQCSPTGTNCHPVSLEFGVHGHLGNGVYLNDRPCADGPNGCGQGCFLNQAQGAYGHPTYWWDAAVQQAEFGASARDFDKDTLDTKSLNCVAQLLLAAFCAWDGGRLPTQTELGGVYGNPNSAWGAKFYPWGNTPSFRDAWTPTDAGKKQYKYYCPTCNPPTALDAPSFFVPMLGDNVVDYGAPARNTTNWNPFSWSVPEMRYAFPPRPAATWARADQAFAIAAPGRMVRDRNSTGAAALDGWFDVASNLIEATGQFHPDNDDASHNAWPRAYWVGGSFEGHEVASNTADPNSAKRKGFELNVLTKYGKQGGRCARPIN